MITSVAIDFTPNIVPDLSPMLDQATDTGTGTAHCAHRGALSGDRENDENAGHRSASIKVLLRIDKLRRGDIERIWVYGLLVG